MGFAFTYHAMLFISAVSIAAAQVIFRFLAPGGLMALLSPKGMLAFALYGASFLFYFSALRHVPLHLAYQYAVLTYIIVSLSAALVLGEHITSARYIGIGLITLGMLLVFSK
jgi:drug/metabolite transporter (DMT)-like permease